MSIAELIEQLAGLDMPAAVVDVRLTESTLATGVAGDYRVTGLIPLDIRHGPNAGQWVTLEIED